MAFFTIVALEYVAVPELPGKNLVFLYQSVYHKLPSRVGFILGALVHEYPTYLRRTPVAPPSQKLLHKMEQCLISAQDCRHQLIFTVKTISVKNDIKQQNFVDLWYQEFAMGIVCV